MFQTKLMLGLPFMFYVLFLVWTFQASELIRVVPESAPIMALDAEDADPLTHVIRVGAQEIFGHNVLIKRPGRFVDLCL